jgi:hypothetical protein
MFIAFVIAHLRRNKKGASYIDAPFGLCVIRSRTARGAYAVFCGIRLYLHNTTFFHFLLYGPGGGGGGGPAGNFFGGSGYTTNRFLSILTFWNIPASAGRFHSLELTAGEMFGAA